MKRPISQLILAAAATTALFTVQAGCVRPGNVANDTVVFQHVTVVPMDRAGTLVDQSVVVRDGIIRAMGPAATVTVPPGSRRVDGGGRFLIPGLADLHVHPLSRDELVQYLRHGVTTIMIMRGRPTFLAWRDSIEAGRMIGPSIYSVGPTTGGLPPLGWKFVGIGTPEAARCVVAHQAGAGYDAIKVYNGYTEPAHAALNQAAAEEGIPVVGHIPRDMGAVATFAAGQDLIAHGEEFYFADFRQSDDTPDIARVPAIVRAAAESGAYVMPMLSSTPEIIRLVEDPEGVLADRAMTRISTPLFHGYRSENNAYSGRPNPGAFVARNRIMYSFLQDFTRALYDAGVPLLAGTDAGVVGAPGAQLHRELAELVAAGLPSHAALAAATVEAGRFAREHLRETVAFGVIRPGARADLVLLEANPLQQVSSTERIAGVMAQGRWFPLEELESMQKEVTSAYAEQRIIVERFDSLAWAGQIRAAVELAREAVGRYSGPLFHESVVRSHAVVAFDEAPEAALEMLRLNAELYPDFHAMQTTLGLASLASGDTTAAISAYRRALELTPCDGVARAALEELGALGAPEPARAY